MKGSKRREQEHESAWIDTKAAVGAYAKNPCAATEKAVSAALGKVRELSACVPEAQKRPKAKQDD